MFYGGQQGECLVTAYAVSIISDAGLPENRIGEVAGICPKNPSVRPGPMEG